MARSARVAIHCRLCGPGSDHSFLATAVNGPKRIITWLIIAFLIFFVAFRPSAAGDVVRTLGAVASDILTGIGGFFDSLVNNLA